MIDADLPAVLRCVYLRMGVPGDARSLPTRRGSGDRRSFRFRAAGLCEVIRQAERIEKS
jgi:hypothetical protein